MADNFLGEIRIVPFDFAPLGWALCDGQLLAISQNAALFSLLGVNYGGNGTSNYGLPNLQGRTAVDSGNGIGLTPRSLGEIDGVENVTITQGTMAGHTHTLNGTTAGGTATTPANNVYAVTPGSRGQEDKLYVAAPQGNPVSLYQTFIGPVGGNLPHNNMQPYLVLNYIIALQGAYPPRQ